MRSRYRRLACVPLLAFVLGGCDSTQPDRVDVQTIQIDVTATNAFAFTFDVWDMREDTDGDGVGDGELNTWCQTPVVGNSSVSTNSVPWTYAAEVRVLRNGQTASEAITTTAALRYTSGLSVTEYDTKVINGLTSAKAPITVTDPNGGAQRTFVFTNPRRLTKTHGSVIRQTTNPLSAIAPQYGYGNGICSLFDPGPPRLDGTPLPFEIELHKGDTVLVNLSRGDAVPGVVDGNGNPLVILAPKIDAGLKLDGLSVSVDANTTTTEEIGSVISFSFTTR